MENQFYFLESKTEKHYKLSDNLRTDTTTSNYSRKSLQAEEKVLISISNPIIKEGFRKYVMYTISGSDNLGSFEAYRRYKDFIRLRNLLVEHWPGCFIPYIPPKKNIVNLI